MITTLRAKLAQLPTTPGVYLYKDAAGKIIYVGKAAVLKNRVGSYFQKSTIHTPKNQLLVADIADVDWITVGSEVEALFLESELIKRYRPKYNVDLKDDKHWNYVKITTKQTFPVLSYVRRPLDDGATYFGPFTSGDALKRAMKFLRRVFPYVTHDPLPARDCLQYHLGLCPGPEGGHITAAAYKRTLRQLSLYLRGQGDKLMTQFERDMKVAARHKDYEAAARARDQLRDLQALSQQMIFGDTELFDLTRDHALVGLGERLGIPAPHRIEAYDISHLAGTDNVASLIVFTDGVANRGQYRRFKMRLRGNDDFAHMREVMVRRFSTRHLGEWPKPDLILIDGGQGQLAAALGVLDELGIAIPAIGLAKRLEEIVHRTTKFETILLPTSSAVLQLLQRVRDEAHRFAVTYQALLRGQRQTHSQLDEVPGVGEATRKKLIKAFGSVRGVKTATAAELAAAVGVAKASAIQQHLGSAPTDL